MTLDGSYTPQKTQQKAIRRSKFEIWAELMEACARIARSQSWLLRKVGLKTSAIKEYLNFLTTAGLIKQLTSPHEDRNEYRTTSKGEEALTQYYQLVTKYFAQDSVV